MFKQKSVSRRSEMKTYLLFAISNLFISVSSAFVVRDRSKAAFVRPLSFSRKEYEGGYPI